MTHHELLKEICSREIEFKLYDVSIHNISIYNFVRRIIRNQIMSLNGYDENTSSPPIPLREYRISVLISFFHLLKLIVRHKPYEVVFHSFERIEKINNVYVDKFTDPIIDYSNVNNNYIILEPGRGGRHYTPRIHSKKIIYTEFINWFARQSIRFNKKKYLNNYSNEIELLFSSISKAFPEIQIDRNLLLNYIIRGNVTVSIYKFFFNQIKVKKFVAPARASFMNIIPAAKMTNVKVFELQHGITYSESLTYSGFIDPLFSPDYFLSFGKLNSAKCYGISDDKVIEIGWAFENYINKGYKHQIDNNKVLIISSPDISNQMVNITHYLASQNPNIKFVFRPHPSEQLDNKRRNQLNSLSNIVLDNNLDNIMVSLMNYNNVIGENSTVLYEALSMGKKVGKLRMENLVPEYLNKDDAKYFYEITDNLSFIDFIMNTLHNKTSKKIYSTFKPEVINKLLIS